MMTEAAQAVNLGVLRWRVLSADGLVLREWTADVLRSFVMLDDEIARLRPSHGRQAAVVVVSDPDGDLWPEGQWKRARTLEPPW